MSSIASAKKGAPRTAELAAPACATSGLVGSGNCSGYGRARRVFSLYRVCCGSRRAPGLRKPCAGPKKQEAPGFKRQSGGLIIKEVRKQCTRNATHPVMCSEALSRLVGPHQRYGYDLIVHVGLARYLRGKQREEIHTELDQECGFRLSEGSISNLCDRFLVYFEALHLARVSVHTWVGISKTNRLRPRWSPISNTRNTFG